MKRYAVDIEPAFAPLSRFGDSVYDFFLNFFEFMSSNLISSRLTCLIID